MSSAPSPAPAPVARRTPHRGLSSPTVARPTHNAHLARSPSCTVLPSSLDALDLSSSTPSLARLREHVLSHLELLESSLAQLDPPAAVDDARAWLHDALAMLQRIRADVTARLPDLSYPDFDAYSSNLKSHLPDVPSLEDVRHRLSDFDTTLSDMRTRIDDLSMRVASLEIDSYHPLHYLPTLYAHLDRLHTHLAAEMHVQLPSSLAQAFIDIKAAFNDVVDKILASHPLSIDFDDKDDDNALERAAKEVARAIKRSVNGASLITYTDLPHAWQNNPFVSRGYRFIPIERWPLIFLSLFALHNETLNIHTHLVPFVVSALRSLFNFSFFQSADAALTPDLPERAFTLFAQVCLLCSVVWHTMAGCAHVESMELCARIDYVGIGWLISASIGTIIYYGFSCHATAIAVYLSFTFLCGVAGSILPFMDWFNTREAKMWRIAFFLTLSFTAVAPLTHLAMLYSTADMFAYIRPIVPSLISYIVGLVFYATHFPECYLARHPNSRLARYLDFLGGGSHAIWHAFIVLAISEHKSGMRFLRGGVAEDVCGGWP